MSLAVGGRKGKQSIVYAGVNSTYDEIQKGTNKHLRTMAVEPSKQKSKSAEAGFIVVEKARTMLFKNPAEDTYQRLLRISGGMGATASAFGVYPQLAVFDTSGANVAIRCIQDLKRDVEDLDIFQVSATEWVVVFCYKYELYMFRVGKEDTEPRLIFTMPTNEPQRPVFRSVRFLTENFCLATANMPNRSGVVLQAYRLPTKENEMAKMATSARIPRKISATALAVANLTQRASLTESQGDAEFVVAVAGHDSSITLYSLQHHKLSAICIVYDLLPLQTFNEVHGMDNITGLSFSTFVAPSKSSSTASTPAREQHIKLASISLQKTIAVHTIPLKKFVDESVKRNPKGPPRPFRYITATRPKRKQARTAMTLLAVVVLILSIVGNVIYDFLHTGSISPLSSLLNPYKFVRPGHPAKVPEVVVGTDSREALREDFFAKVGVQQPPAEGETIVVFETKPTAAADGDAAAQDGQLAEGIEVGVHDEEIHGPGKTWEELGEKGQKAWKKRLHDAGAWTQQMGENVFKGVLFGELAGAVGHAAAG